MRYFLDKLINFNSTEFENYLKKLDEIKKKLRNDTIEEEDKGDDMNLKDDEDGEGTHVIEKKQSLRIFMHKMNKIPALCLLKHKG